MSLLRGRDCHTSVCMPRERAHPHHPMRDLRDALSVALGERITQAVFAKQLGVSASLINAIESSQARPVSEDMYDRVALRYGVRLGVPGRSRSVCMAFPELPLQEGLRKWMAQQARVEGGALLAFDLHTANRIRACLLAAHRKNKAAIFLDVLHRQIEELTHEMGLDAGVAAAAKEIAANKGFPAKLFSENYGALQAYAKGFVKRKG